MIDRDSNRGIGRFAGEPEVQFLRGGELVVLLADFAFTDPSGHTWIAPRGLRSDGASIPRILWPVIGPPIGGPYFDAALQHDARYRLGDCSKAQADLILWDAARCGGTSPHDAFLIAQAVNQFGWSAWSANRLKQAACGTDRARLLAWV